MMTASPSWPESRRFVAMPTTSPKCRLTEALTWIPGIRASKAPFAPSITESPIAWIGGGGVFARLDGHGGRRRRARRGVAHRLRRLESGGNRRRAGVEESGDDHD